MMRKEKHGKEKMGYISSFRLALVFGLFYAFLILTLSLLDDYSCVQGRCLSSQDDEYWNAYVNRLPA